MGGQCRKQREFCPIDLAIFLSLNWLEKSVYFFETGIK